MTARTTPIDMAKTLPGKMDTDELGAISSNQSFTNTSVKKIVFYANRLLAEEGLILESVQAY